MIKYETINGTLCRMVAPTPLQLDSEFPCVVRLIQDDSPMGRYNQSYSEYRYGVRLGCCMLPIIATHIAKNGVVNDIEWDVSRYEIIGYPVEDGSHYWALYQMMQGHEIINSNGTIPFCHHEDRILRCGDDISWDIDHWLRIYDDTRGWQLYEPQPEPKPEHPAINGYNRYDYIPVEGIRQPKPGPEPPREPEYGICKRCAGAQSVPNPVVSNTAYTTCPKCGGTGYEIEPEPAFKVGDWVEFIDAGGHKSQGKYLSNAYDDTILVRDITYNMRCVVPTTKITRKLDPSEVVVDFGSGIKGTIVGCSNVVPIVKVINGVDWIASIMITALDAATRELVESLLKAQEEQ